MKRPPLSLPKRLSLVAQTVSSLRKGIEEGHWHGSLPGERTLCESLQVSRRTLRSALEELRRSGVLEVSERHRRRIKQKRSKSSESAAPKTIAILLPGSFMSLPSRISFVIDSLRAKLSAAGFMVQFHVNPALYTGSPVKALSQFVVEHPASVWIVLSSKEAMQRWFSRQTKLRCLILGSCTPGIDLPSIDVDFHATCHHAGALLWRKGHRSIAIVLHQGIYGGDIASEDGLRAVLKPMPDAQINVIRHDTTPAHLCHLIDQSLISPRPPTAYIVGGAIHALTLSMHLMRKGKRIPKDITVISRDNDPILEAACPTIARYAVQPAKFASRAALAVRQLAETGTLSAPSIRLIPSFISGESI